MWRDDSYSEWTVWTWVWKNQEHIRVWCGKDGIWLLKGYRIKATNAEEAKQKALKLTIAKVEEELAAMKAALC